MEDIKEIKADVKSLLQQSAVHNQILLEHKQYSQALQKEQEVLKARIEPIEKQSNLISIAFKGIGLITIGAVIQLLIRLFSH